MNTRIKLIPLLSNQYEVGTVRFYGARINLFRNSEGITNWADLAHGEVSTEDQRDSRSFPLAAVVLGGVDIQDVSISWDDQFTGEYYDISNINMNIGELVYGDPIQLTLGFDATSTKPQLSATVALSGNITYNLSNERYDISLLQIDGTITGPNVPEGEAVVHLTQLSQSI